MDIAKLKEQRQHIILPEDVVVYDEIISACENNLLRAAYILTWIAIVESLKRKIYILADMGDARSENTRSNIFDQEKNKNSTDKTIYEGAISCEIVPTRYSSDLEYLWQQRCLYGHPYQYTPKEEDVSWIIEKAFEITLSRSLMYTHLRIEEFLKEEMGAFHIVPQDKKQMEQHILRHIKMVQDKHYSFLFKKLCYYFHNEWTADNKRKGVYLLNFIRLFVKEKSLDLKAAEFCVSKGIANWPVTMWYIASLTEVWNSLTDAHKIALFQYFDGSVDSERHSCITAIHHLVKSGVVLEPKQDAIFYKKLGEIKITQSWQYYEDKNKLLDRIDHDWISGQNWGQQGAYLDWLTSIDNITAQFEDTQIEKLGMFVGKCCRDNAYVAQNYVRSSSGEWFTLPKFNTGVALGLMVYQDKFKFSNNCPNLIITFIATLTFEQQEDIIQAISHYPFEPTNIMIDIQDELRDLMVANDLKLSDAIKQFLNERIDGCFIKRDNDI